MFSSLNLLKFGVTGQSFIPSILGTCSTDQWPREYISLVSNLRKPCNGSKHLSIMILNSKCVINLRNTLKKLSLSQFHQFHPSCISLNQNIETGQTRWKWILDLDSRIYLFNRNKSKIIFVENIKSFNKKSILRYNVLCNITQWIQGTLCSD